MKKIIVLGATGSIGKSTLDVVSNYPEKLEIVGMSAHKNGDKLAELGLKYNCNNLTLTGCENSKNNTINFYGPTQLLDMIKNSGADIVVNGIAGSSGLLPSVTTIESGIDLALANKETMVMAGGIINNLVKEFNVKLLPVDSEHSAIFHLLENCEPDDIDEVILTASGGAFRELPIDKLKDVTLKDALTHPTWDMGAKITIDSASMANKGLEVIEAAQLFNLPADKIKVLIHPQSYVHSLIRKKDLSMYAQISAPDMKLPIQNALFYPRMERVESTFLDLTGKSLTFTEPDYQKYPMLELAYKTLELGPKYYVAYNAANEVCITN
ncbi:MAG: 1-deoxy-D-xylulose-5-phosphate reductoisomerase [Spirochaetaceae bacterium 4572_7]|nr:MAG: 1-deoxy-D-xylulose-5-phosphate reductoisomerase [Spirochaetaceae bacterium 4572_7]